MVAHQQSFKSLAALSLGVAALALAGCRDRTAGQPGPTHVQLAAEGALPPQIRKAPEVVRVAYRFALANRELLQHVPCHCGCGSMGHDSNAACYLSAASAAGKPVFDTHAIGCSICVDITHDVMRLAGQGRQLAEIRSYVESTYGRYGPSNLQ